MTVSEFTVPQTGQSDRRGPGRWILSHVVRHKLFTVGVLAGAFGNAALAAAVPVLIGHAFDAVVVTPPDLRKLAVVTGLIVLSQLARSILLVGRNFSSEVIGQRLERDTRDELYVNLIGKSMSFHDQHPPGDVMARPTTDVREIDLMLNPSRRKRGMGSESSRSMLTSQKEVPTLRLVVSLERMQPSSSVGSSF